MELRAYIRKVLNENINNFLEKQPETETKQLKDNSKPKIIGNPMDVKLNQMADDQGSDEQNSPTVSVSTSGTHSSDGTPNSGKAKPKFDDSTKMAKQTNKKSLSAERDFYLILVR